jgi:hypothetical protein
MKASYLLVFSALGLLSGCSETAVDDADSDSEALRTSRVQQYKGSENWDDLSDELKADVDALFTTPGLATVAVEILDDPKFVKLSKFETTVEKTGVIGARMIITLLRNNAKSRPVISNMRDVFRVTTVGNPTAVRYLAAYRLPNAVSSLGGDPSLGTLAFAENVPTSSPNTGSTDGRARTNGGGPTNASIVAPPADLDAVLAARFAEAARAPSRGELAEWNDLRSRYQASIAQAARIDTFRLARHSGSATLSDDPRAAQKFDQASALVDRFARTDVKFSSDAMNLVHAVVADSDGGKLRRAGQNVFRTGPVERLYLPGANVAAAVSDVFGDVTKRASAAAAPELAAVFDRRMISVHPYMDANGRTTRLMTDWLLTRAGYPPAISTADEAAALFAQDATVERGAHLERITIGMQRSVSLLESSV